MASPEGIRFCVAARAVTIVSRRCPGWVCAVQRRRFPVGANPIRQPLQPEAIGAVMEVTKWLKPSISVSRIGDSARVQAATRVNVEQASKRTEQGESALGRATHPRRTAQARV